MKAILLVRVSTQTQELDAQEKELYELAYRDGYTDADIIPIAEKESGIKLKEEERLGLNRLKEEVEKGDVKDVYIWEVSRLARTKKVLFSMQDYFVSRKIQVTFKAPNYFQLLDKDGSVNEGADMIFTIYAQMAESEMRNKKARFARARRRNEEAGKYSGGNVPFGYVKDENGFLVICDEDAEIVRFIFNEIASGRSSYYKVGKELNDRGYRCYNPMNGTNKTQLNRTQWTYCAIQTIIHNTIYYGEADAMTFTNGKHRASKVSKGYKRRLPPIITQELFDKANAVASQKGTKVTNATKHPYRLGAKMIKCPICGHYFYYQSTLYMCLMHAKSKMINLNATTAICPNDISISASQLDSLLWCAAASEHFYYLQTLRGKKGEEIDEKIKVLQLYISKLEKELLSVDEKKERADDIYFAGRCTKEKWIQRLSDIDAESKAMVTKIADYKNEITALTAYKGDEWLGDIRLYDSLEALLKLDDEEKKYKIVRQHIKEVELERAEYKSFKRVLKITIHFWNKEYEEYLYIRRGKGVIYELKNGEVVCDDSGEPIPTGRLDIYFDMLVDGANKAIAKEAEKHRAIFNADDARGITNYRFNPVIITPEIKEDVDKIKQLNPTLTDNDVAFIVGTAYTFSVGTPREDIADRIDRLLKLGIIEVMPKASLPTE